ncbi:MAG TPA: phage holin family protein [Patescibacteria group bacterium]|nr:phage holin family protein [Patescibacteria group bacterium]
MRQLFSKFALSALSLFLVSLFLSGIKISGGFVNYVIAGALLAVLSTIMDPIVKVITLPFNLLTLGLLSFLTTLVSLFALTILFQNVTVASFTFPGFDLLGITVGHIHFSLFLSFVVISATIYFLDRFLVWLFK